MATYVARYCVENVVEQDDLIELLEDLMDEEFETVCHDDSPKGSFTLSFIVLISLLFFIVFQPNGTICNALVLSPTVRNRGY